MWFRRVPDRTLAVSLLVEEYRSLREEIHQSLAYAQGIVRWMVAIFGAILAAALVAAEHAVGYDFLSISLLVLFGFAVPGMVWAAAWTWLGELIRMERAGAYLRGLERQLSKLDVHNELGFTLLRWETFIFSQRRLKSLFGKNTAAYLGTAAVFFGATAVAYAFMWAWWVHLFTWEAGWDFSGTLWLWPVLSSILEIGLTVVAFLLFRQLKLLGEEIAPLS